MAFRTLVIGYGNPGRADDGVAYHVVNALRVRLGQRAQTEHGPCGGGTEYQPRQTDGGTEYQTGLDDLGAATDSILLTQLVPELVDTLRDYDQVIFVDAHVQEHAPDLQSTSVTATGTGSVFAHHMTPSVLLSLLKALYHREPLGHVVAIRGHDWSFRDGLSAPTAALVLPAVEAILRLVASGASPWA
jgi:Ni,Fe-hydrogenase maturation factor